MCPVLPPTPNISFITLLKALHPFPVGSGPGPDDMRAGFLKRIIGYWVDSEGFDILNFFSSKY